MHTGDESAISLLARAAVKELPCLDLLQKAEEKSPIEESLEEKVEQEVEEVDWEKKTWDRVAGVKIDSLLELLAECSNGKHVDNLELLCQAEASLSTCEDLEDPFEVKAASILPPDCFPLDILLHGCGHKYPHLEILKGVITIEKEKQQQHLRRLSENCPPTMKGIWMLTESQESVLKGVQALVVAAVRDERERVGMTPSPTPSRSPSLPIDTVPVICSLQKAGRGYFCRKQVAVRSRAALSIQLVYRAYRKVSNQRRKKANKTRLCYQRAAEEYAAILLQSCIRGFLVRKLLANHDTHDTSLEPLVDPADVTPEDAGISPLEPGNCSRISTGSRRRSSSYPAISMLISMSEGTGLQMLLNSRVDSFESLTPLGAEHTPRVPSEGSIKTSHRRKIAKGLLPDECKRPKFHHASYLARKALPAGKRLTHVLLTAIGATDAGWDLEQAPDICIDEVFVERHGVAIDTVYDAINPYGSAQPNGPHAAEVYGDGLFAITKDELLDHRDSAVLYSHYKGQVLSSLLSFLTDSAFASWVDCFKSIPLRDLRSQSAKHRLSRMLNDQLAMAEGTVTGMEKRLEHLYKKAAAPSKVADSLVEQLNTDLEEAKQARRLLVAALESLTLPLPDMMGEVLDSDDDYMLGLSMDDVAKGTCVAQDTLFMMDGAGQLTTSPTIHTVFTPCVVTETVPNTLYNTYKLAMSAIEQRGIPVCCLSPLLPRATITAIAHPQHTVALHLMALAEVLSEQSWGLTTCYISSFDVPVEIARRAFEKRVMDFELVVHALDSQYVALELGHPCSLLVPAEPLNILCGRVGARWFEARGKAYRQEEEVISSSTAVLSQAVYNTVYFEPVRHKLVDKKVPLLQRPLPPKRAPYTAGKVVESRLPLGPKQKKRNMSILAKVQEVQSADLVLQKQLTEQGNPTVRSRKMLERMAEGNEERQNFIQRLEKRIENAPSQRELQKMDFVDRDERIRQRREKKLLEQQVAQEQRKQEEVMGEKLRKERNRQHQMAAAERQRRQLEKKERAQNEKEGAQILAEARENAERQKKVQEARELILNERQREERRERMRKEREAARAEGKQMTEVQKQDEEKRRIQQQEDVRRKLQVRAAEEREKRMARKAEEEQAKERELRRRHVPKRGLPMMLPPMERAAAMHSHRENGQAAAAAGKLPPTVKTPQPAQPERCSSAPDDLSKPHFENMPSDDKAQTHTVPRAPPSPVRSRGLPQETAAG